VGPHDDGHTHALLCHMLSGGPVKIAKLAIDGSEAWALQHHDAWHGLTCSLDVLLAELDLAAAARAAVSDRLCRAADVAARPAAEPFFLAPIESQEAWAAGVTYKRSREARKVEAGGADFYDRIYASERPEIFLKATRSRTVGPGGEVGIRSDSRWNVPEPELALVLNRSLDIVGFTIGNDMSSRDIEGENPLYLPQAKVYDRCLGLGPYIVTADDVPDPLNLEIHLRIVRAGRVAFEGSTSTGQLNRRLPDLCAYLGRCARYPVGAILLTGTGVVPPDAFTLAPNDTVVIRIEGIGELTNTVTTVPA
jgi:2-dehydro-3-deoxy-D-arabinonate dehydratase